MGRPYFLTLTDARSDGRVTINCAHLISIEASGTGSLLILSFGQTWLVVESREQVVLKISEMLS